MEKIGEIYENIVTLLACLWYLPEASVMEDVEPMLPEKDTKIDEIVEELNRRVVQGHYVAGQRLPSERELADELNVSRVTIRAALLASSGKSY